MFGPKDITWNARKTSIQCTYLHLLLLSFKIVQFYALQPKPILDFSVSTTIPESLLQANADFAFVPYFTPAIVFQFVKKDGVKRKLIDLLNKSPDSI